MPIQATRWEILKTLKERGQATVEELASVLELATITVRYHLGILENESLVTSTKVRRSVGRPHYLYTLTEGAEDLFPKKYHLFASRLLDSLKTSLGDEELDSMLTKMAQSIAAPVAAKLQGRGLEERLSALVELLGEEGFMADWRREGTQYILSERSCPYYYVGQRHPEICHLDVTMMVTVLDAPVERHSCILDGDECCSFWIESAGTGIIATGSLS
ncbi:MAG: ArsR family transcriptional regulator [Chloroflexi bacterium]|nr:ArsR family transcriptional regulator [Chloroflexota bacterium]